MNMLSYIFYLLFVRPIKIIKYYGHLLFIGLPHPDHLLEKMDNNIILSKQARTVSLHYCMLSKRFPDMPLKSIIFAMSHINGISKKEIKDILIDTATRR